MILIIMYLAVSVTMWDMFPLSDMGNWDGISRAFFVIYFLFFSAADIAIFHIWKNR